MVRCVPSGTDDFSSISSAHFLMFTSPMPAPNPSSRTQSDAVEYPGFIASSTSGIPGPVSIASTMTPHFSTWAVISPPCGIRGKIDLRLVGGNPDPPEERGTDAQFFERVLEFARRLACVFQGLTGDMVLENEADVVGDDVFKELPHRGPLARLVYFRLGPDILDLKFLEQAFDDAPLGDDADQLLLPIQYGVPLKPVFGKLCDAVNEEFVGIQASTFVFILSRMRALIAFHSGR